MVVSDRPIVVGVDGTEHSRVALSWAVEEARRRRAMLHLVLSGDPARADYAEDTLRVIAAECRREAPDLEIVEEVSLDHPVDTLIRLSAGAQLIVVGSRGHGGFVDALLGSVSVPLAAQSACPVVVTPPARAGSRARRTVPDAAAPKVGGRRRPACASSTGSPASVPERSPAFAVRSAT